MVLFFNSKFCKNELVVFGFKIRIDFLPVKASLFELGLNLPKFVPAKYIDLLNTISFVSNYINYSDYDFESEKFIFDYKNLIFGLDEKSILNVNNVISIYRKYNQLKKKKVVNISDLESLNNLLSSTNEEKFFINNEFYSNILRLDNNLYKYKEYLLPNSHFESSVFYHRHSIDELNSLNLIKEKCIIDVGGFIGDSALVFSPYTNKTVYSFEASPENFYLMQKTIEMNGLKNVVPVQLALGAKVDEKLCLSGAGSCTIIDDNEGKKKSSLFAINSTTLDDYVKKNNLDVGLIKVDIEGYEQEFLKGSENTIKAQKPALLISIYHKPEDYLYIKPLIESWNLGYKFRIICPPENRLFETLLVAEVV